MIISHKYKFIFTRVAKTGSSSLVHWKSGPLRLSRVKFEQPLEELREASVSAGTAVPAFVYQKYETVDDFCTGEMINDWNHIPMHVAKKYMQPWLYNKYYKFGFVRNPYDRLVSAFEYAKQFFKKKSGGDYNIYRKNETYWKLHNFKQWILTEFARNGKCGKYGWQCLYVDGCDFVGRFENLEHDVKHALDTIDPDIYTPLEHTNRSKSSSKHYSEWYDDETREIVSQLYFKDLEQFNYTFEFKD